MPHPSPRDRLLRTSAGIAVGGAVLLALAALIPAPRASSARPRLAEADGVRASDPYTSPTATLTPGGETATATPNLVETAVAATLTALVPSATPSPTRTAVPTVGPTVPPRPLFLPIAIKDPPYSVDVGYLDVVFVLDGSNYMREVRGPRRQTAWDVGKDMIQATIAMLDMVPDGSGRQDQAGIVVFRKPMRPAEEFALTADPGKIAKFVSDLTWLVDGEAPLDQTNMDVGLRRGRDLAKGIGHKASNKPVVIVVSEMQAKGVGYNGVDACEDTECAMLYWADDVKASGVSIALFATSYANRGEELQAMASDPSLALLLPTPDEMRAALESLRPRTAPPPESYWPYR